MEHYIEQHEMELGRGVAVKTAANLAMQLVYNNKVSHSIISCCLLAVLTVSDAEVNSVRNVCLKTRWTTCHPCIFASRASCCFTLPVGAVQNMLQAGMIIAGWDPIEGGAVYALPLGGTLLKVPFSIG